MIRSRRLWVWLAIATAVALVIIANWRFVDLALRSQPGCVPVTAERPAAKHGC